MISQATDTTLRAMKLTGMANELARQIANPKSVLETDLVGPSRL